MTDRYHQFKILYSLFDRLHKGREGWQNKATIIGEEELRYIPKDTSNVDIIHLVGDGLLEVKDESNVQYLKYHRQRYWNY